MSCVLCAKQFDDGGGDIAFCSLACADAFADYENGQPCRLESCLNVVPDDSSAAFCSDACLCDYAYAPRWF